MKPTVSIRRAVSGSLCVCILALWWTLTAAQTRVYIDIDQAGGYLLPVAIPKLLGEPDHPKLAEEIRVLGKLMEQLDMRQGTRHQNDVIRAIAHDLIGDAQAFTISIFRFDHLGLSRPGPSRILSG